TWLVRPSFPLTSTSRTARQRRISWRRVYVRGQDHLLNFYAEDSSHDDNALEATKCRHVQRGRPGALVVPPYPGTFPDWCLVLALDLTNVWFHRQSAQTAADAACTAGAMDLPVGAQVGATGHQGF